MYRYLLTTCKQGKHIQCTSTPVGSQDNCRLMCKGDEGDPVSCQAAVSAPPEMTPPSS